MCRRRGGCHSSGVCSGVCSGVVVTVVATGVALALVGNGRVVVVGAGTVVATGVALVGNGRVVVVGAGTVVATGVALVGNGRVVVVVVGAGTGVAVAANAASNTQPRIFKTDRVWKLHCRGSNHKKILQETAILLRFDEKTKKVNRTLLF